MSHQRDLQDLRLEACELTIGALDGVHRGHQALVRAMVEHARRERMASVVLTFYPHPSVVLRGRRPSYYITLPSEKAALLHDLGVDHVITQTFDREFSRIPAEIFLRRLVDQIHLRHLWAGDDFAFGFERRGNLEFLRDHAGRFGYEVHVIPPVQLGGEVVSSTRVRETLRAGDVARAAEYLGRRYILPGVVMRGAGRGRPLGIPTANLDVAEERAVPGPGVYACWAVVQGHRHRAVANVGFRPTFEEAPPRPVVEAHLLAFDADLYGQEVGLEFVARLRDERKFSGPQELLEQIRRDIRRAEEILAGVPEADHG
jgi:riboflavin kinase/FMN adenylyltransferase